MGLENNKLICKKCGRECRNWNSLSNHIVQKHKMKVKEYYDKYLRKDNNEGKCLNCRKETKFLGIRGYSIYCSWKCSNRSIIKKEKEKFTCKNKYGCENVSQCKEIKEKKVQTNLKNRKVKYTFQSKEVREKGIITNLKRYGVSNAMQCKKIQEKGKQTFLNKYGVNHWSKTDQGKLCHRLTAIKWIEVQRLNNEKLCPHIGNEERIFLNELQKNSPFKIIKNDASFRYVVGRFPDGHINEVKLFIQFDELNHFLDKNCKNYKQDDIDCTLQLASLGYVVFRVSELEWKNNKEKVIEQFKSLVQYLTEESIIN